MQVKQIVLYGFAGSIVLAIATGGKENLQQVQASLDESNKYAQAQDANKTSIDNAKRESNLAWEMVQQENIVPVVGLTPKVNEWAFVPVPLAVGQVVTVGGKKEQPYAPGTLLGDATGRIGRVGLNGKVESPINGSQNPNYLPVIPMEHVESYSQTFMALQQRRNIPQAVVSSLQELAQRRIDMEARNPVQPIQTTTPVQPTKQPTQVPPVESVKQTQPENEKVAQTTSYPTFKETEVVESLPKVNVN